MNRRSFLSILGAGAAGLALEQASGLWAPTKTIFLPPAGGWRTGVDWSSGDSVSVLQIRPLANPWEPKIDLHGAPEGVFRKGDVFTIEGLYARNPATWKETPYLQHFVVTEDQVGVSAVPMNDIHPDPRILDSTSRLQTAMNQASGRKGFRDYRSDPPNPRVFERAMRAAMGRASRRQKAWS